MACLNAMLHANSRTPSSLFVKVSGKGTCYLLNVSHVCLFKLVEHIVTHTASVSQILMSSEIVNVSFRKTVQTCWILQTLILIHQVYNSLNASIHLPMVRYKPNQWLFNLPLVGFGSNKSKTPEFLPLQVFDNASLCSSRFKFKWYRYQGLWREDVFTIHRNFSKQHVCFVRFFATYQQYVTFHVLSGFNARLLQLIQTWLLK